MSTRSALVTKALRFALIGLGATLVISSVVNLTAAWQLIEAAEEQALGVTRNQIFGFFSLLLACGVALIVLGLRGRR